MAKRSRWGSAKTRQKRRSLMYDAQGGACHYCGQTMKLDGGKQGRPAANYATFEHLVPRCEGGKWLKSNIVLACFQCNFARHAKTPTQDEIQRT